MPLILGLVTVSDMIWSNANQVTHQMRLEQVSDGIVFFFIFLPKKEDEERTFKNNIIFASIQFFILVTYTLTGVWKLLGMAKQLMQGETSLLNPGALSHILQFQFEISGKAPYFSSIFLENKFFGFLLLWLAIILELCSVFIFFKASLHKIWGILLIGMHAGIALILDVNFYVAPFVLGVFFVLSPFQQKVSVKRMCYDLPLIGFCLKKIGLSK
mgnify:CR=1 FL=1